MLRRVLVLIWKELQTQFKDPDSRRLLFMPLMIQVVLYSFAATLEVKNNTLAIYNQDMGAYSVELIQRFAKAQAFPHLIMLHSQTELTSTIDNQRALLAISFPADFSRLMSSGQSAPLQVILDGRRSNSAQIAFSYLQNMVQEYQTELQFQAENSSYLSTISVRNWFNPNLEYQWFILPSLIAIITTLGCLVVTAMSIAREREQGTFQQLLVSPLTPGYMMIGKIIPALLIAAGQATIILCASIYLYKIPFQGSICLLYFSLICYVLSLAGIGLFISSISATQQQAFLGVFAFLMPAFLLSGYVSPVENIPEPLRSLTWFNPVRHFIAICKGIYLKGLTLDLIWHNLWPLLIIALLSLSLAYFQFKHYSK